MYRSRRSRQSPPAVRWGGIWMNILLFAIVLALILIWLSPIQIVERNNPSATVYTLAIPGVNTELERWFATAIAFVLWVFLMYAGNRLIIWWTEKNRYRHLPSAKTPQYPTGVPSDVDGDGVVDI